MMLFEYSYLYNNGQKTKWLIQITENSRYGSDQRERVISPELFGLIPNPLRKKKFLFKDQQTIPGRYPETT